VFSHFVQFAPTALRTGSWPLAVAGQTDLGHTEHRTISVSDRDSDSSVSLAVSSLTFRRNVVLTFSKVKGTKSMTFQKD